MDTAPHQVYPSIDWFSLTTGPGPDAATAWDTCVALADEQNQAGNDTRPWSANGYVGWGTRNLRFGRRGDDCAVELSGELAERYWLNFALLAATCTRIDRAVTVTYGHTVTDLAVNGYDAPGVTLPGMRAPITKTLLRGTRGGQTLYVGAMGGRRLGRLYDKHAESRGEYPPNTWRYELQDRRPHSDLVSRDLGRARDVRSAIGAGVHRFFSRHGVQPWFLSDGAFVPGIRRRPRSDLSTRVNWWEQQVAPGVRRSLGCADRNTIATALGLNDGYLG